MKLAIIAVALLVGAEQAPTRPPARERPPLAPGTASIEGRVLDGASEKPVAGVEVRLTDTSLVRETNVGSVRSFIRGATTKTDRNGFFAFEKVAGGTYSLFAISPRHLPGCYGSTPQMPRRCVPLEIASDQQLREIAVYLEPGGMVTGTVFDHEGRAVPNIAVLASPTDQERGLGGVAESDANGRFEIGGLRAGPVLLRTEVVGKGGVGPYRVYYPGVLDSADAQPLAIEAGATVEIDLRLPRVTAAAITATVLGPDGFSLDRLRLMQPEKNIHLPISSDNGVGRVINLRSGRYLIEARARLGEKSLAAFEFVELQDVDLDVALVLQPTGDISGRIVADRGGVPPLDGVRVAAVWVRDGTDLDPMGLDEISVGPDGVFRMNALFGTRVFKVIGLPAEWHVAQITAGRSNVTAGLDVATGLTELTIHVSRR